MKRVAIYLRLSLEDDVNRDESNSITGQRTLLQEFVRSHDEFAGWEITEYFDDGISGSLFAGRGAFQTMLADAKEGKFQCLIVKDFSRLGRNYLEAGNFMEYVFPAMGLRFISVNDHYDSFKRQGMTGGIDVAFKNLIHQMYAMDGSQKVKSAKRVRNARGEYTAGLAPYGYRKDPADVHRFVIEEREAEVVREIFSLAADGSALLPTSGEEARMKAFVYVSGKIQKKTKSAWTAKKKLKAMYNYALKLPYLYDDTDKTAAECVLKFKKQVDGDCADTNSFMAFCGSVLGYRSYVLTDYAHWWGLVNGRVCDTNFFQFYTGLKTARQSGFPYNPLQAVRVDSPYAGSVLMTVHPERYDYDTGIFMIYDDHFEEADFALR